MKLLPSLVIASCLVGATVFAEDTATAKAKPENWTKMCARCHGADGSGNTKAGKKLNVKDYTSAEVQQKMTDADMLKAILEGVKDESGKERMQAFKEKLTEDQAKELVKTIREMGPQPAPAAKS